MRALRKLLDRAHPLFARGGRYHKFFAVYEMVDTLLYSPGDTTRNAPHVRDAIDLKRVMIVVVVAVMPAALVGMWNTGFQANSAMLAMGIDGAVGWRGSLLDFFGVGYDPGNHVANLLHGFVYFLPIYVVTMAAGGFWEVLFAAVRNHEVNEGFFVTSMLYRTDTSCQHSTVAGCDRDFIRRRDRQGSLWRHRQELSQPGPGRTRVSVFCLPGPDVGRRGVDRGGRIQRCDGARPRGRGRHGGRPWLRA